MERSRRILTLPNVLSLLRLAFIPLILFFLLKGDPTRALIFFVAAGISDGLDGLLARLLQQKTLFGMYLDPIADKLLLSSAFLVLAMTGEVRWLVAGVVLARDLVIMAGVLVLVLTTDIRQFPPTVLGKANTMGQIVAVFALLLDEVYGFRWLHYTREVLLLMAPILAAASGIQYAYRTVRLLRARPGPAPAPTP